MEQQIYLSISNKKFIAVIFSSSFCSPRVCSTLLNMALRCFSLVSHWLTRHWGSGFRYWTQPGCRRQSSTSHAGHHSSVWFAVWAKWAIEVSQWRDLVHAGMRAALTPAFVCAHIWHHSQASHKHAVTCRSAMRFVFSLLRLSHKFRWMACKSTALLERLLVFL